MFNVNQITSELAKMADPMLQKYAAMHKNDPYTVALAVGESNRRKSLRTAAQGRMAGQQQPKVVDQDIAQMAAPVDYADAMGNMMGVLPENTGIGKLPAPNLKRMADGGIAGYADRGTVEGDPKQAFATEYRPIAEKVGARLGIDPGILISQWGHESGWGKKTVGKYNFGNIKDVTGKGPRAHDKIEGSRSSYKSYESPEQFAEDYTKLIEKNFPKAINTGNNVNAFSEGLKEGVKGPYATDKKYAEKLTNTYTNLFPAAQAAPAAQNMAALIPTGGTGSGPTPAAAKEVGFLSPEYMENKFGLSPDVARNVYNTMMAPTPLAPASTLPKTGGYMSKAYQGLAGLGEKAYNKLVPSSKLSEEGIAALQAERAAERAAEAAKATQLRLTPPSAPLTEGSGVIPVTKTGQGVVQSAEELEKVRLANQAADQLAASQAAARAAEGVGNVPSAAEKIQTASLLREADEAQRLQNAAKTATNVKTNLATTQAPIGGISDLAPKVEEKASTATGVDQTAIEELKKKYAEEDGKKGTASSGFFNDPMGILGLQLMANKNPNLLGAVGEAGQGTAKYLSDLRKAESEQGYYGAKGEEARATAALYNRGAKDRNMQLEAEKLVQKGMEDWSKSTAGKLGGIQNPQAAQLEEARLRRIYYQQLGLSLTPLQSDTNVPTSGAGFKFLGARP